MRTLTSGNKTNFAIFIFIIVIILVIIVSAVFIGLQNKTEKYQISSTATVYDNDYKYIDLENDAGILKKWTGDYYLEEEGTKKEYNLGRFAISYEKTRNSLDLFGTFYQIQQGGEINKLTDHNTITSTIEDRFFKIDDRKYLIIAKNIKNNTGSLYTQNYLIVILDKLGNALLLNNEVNFKTINEMIISTDDFEFDVANEILRYKDENINLKKVIGSTNEYVYHEEEKEEEEEEQEESTQVATNGNGGVVVAPGGATTTTTTTTTNNNSTTIIQNNNNGNNSNNSSNNSNNNKQDTEWVNTLNNWISDVASGFESIYNGSSNKKDDSTLSKSITLNSLSAGTTSIDINYTVVDPENKYNVVYAVILSDNESYNISLDKSANTYKVRDLQPNTNYSVQIGYKIIYADSTTEEVLQDTMVIRTKGATESLEIVRVSVDRIYYTLKLDSDFIYDAGCKLVIYLNDEKYSTINLTESILEKAASSGYTSSFKIPDEYKNKGSSIKIQLEDTKMNNSEINTNINTKIVNY